MKKYKYSEIFGKTIQGEGRYTGYPTVWIRFWGCNFECNGFGQDTPEDPTTYNLDYQTIDVSSIKHMNDLPVFSKGCDSSYSWSKKFAHLANTSSVSDICDKLEYYLISESNPGGKFLHPESKQWTHLAFTGGEPMMNQSAIVDIMQEFDRRENSPKYVTIETNGTQMIRENFQAYFGSKVITEFLKGFTLAGPLFNDIEGRELFWSVSPKLYLSGEKWEDAIRSEIVAGYKLVSNVGQLKYVSNGSARSWDEVKQATKEYAARSIDWPVWIMPVGADIEGQNKVAARITEGAVERGYNVAARVHTYIFGNVVGK
jgi:organic radical activating enzyme